MDRLAPAHLLLQVEGFAIRDTKLASYDSSMHPIIRTVEHPCSSIVPSNWVILQDAFDASGPFGCTIQTGDRM